MVKYAGVCAISTTVGGFGEFDEYGDTNSTRLCSKNTTVYIEKSRPTTSH